MERSEVVDEKGLEVWMGGRGTPLYTIYSEGVLAIGLRGA